jgi:hypothetical protein
VLILYGAVQVIATPGVAYNFSGSVYRACAVGINNGSVLIYGNYNYNSTFLLDPMTQTVTTGPDLNQLHYYANCLSIPGSAINSSLDGVLIMGANADYGAAWELYGANNMYIWESLGGPALQRPGVVYFPDRYVVVVVGGWNTSSLPTNKVFVYSIATRVFESNVPDYPLAVMGVACVYHWICACGGCVSYERNHIRVECTESTSLR